MSIANGRPWRAGGRLGRLLAALILCSFWGADVAAQGLTEGAPTGSPALVADGAAIDVHTHVASPALTELFAVFAGEDLLPATADDLVERLDEGNVRRAVILSAGYLGAPVGWTDATHMAAENDFVAAEVARHPDRLLGFCGINPVVDGAADEIDRCLALPGMVGVKLHLEGSGVNLTDPAHVAGLGAVFARVAERDAPVLIHVADERGYSLDNQRFAALSEILLAHPTVRVAHAHCANWIDDHGIETWLRLPRSGYNPETSYVDVSACLRFYSDAPLSHRELLVWRLRKWGIGHVLFGSDYFAADGATPREALETLTLYPFTQDELDTILSNDGSDWLGR
jgi:predicted TIM-barrel fold metal-dependent hydrolase